MCPPLNGSRDRTCPDRHIGRPLQIPLQHPLTPGQRAGTEPRPYRPIVVRSNEQSRTPALTGVQQAVPSNRPMWASARKDGNTNSHVALLHGLTAQRPVRDLPDFRYPRLLQSTMPGMTAGIPPRIPVPTSPVSVQRSARARFPEIPRNLGKVSQGGQGPLGSFQGGQGGKYEIPPDNLSWEA